MILNVVWLAMTSLCVISQAARSPTLGPTVQNTCDKSPSFTLIVHGLNSDLSYSRFFGRKGSRPGELNFPRGLAIDSDGMVYIADRDNNQVQKFTPEGEVLAVLSKETLVVQVTMLDGLCKGLHLIAVNNTMWLAMTSLYVITSSQATLYKKYM